MAEHDGYTVLVDQNPERYQAFVNYKERYRIAAAGESGEGIFTDIVSAAEAEFQLPAYILVWIFSGEVPTIYIPSDHIISFKDPRVAEAEQTM